MSMYGASKDRNPYQNVKTDTTIVNKRITGDKTFHNLNLKSI